MIIAIHAMMNVRSLHPLLNVQYYVLTYIVSLAGCLSLVDVAISSVVLVLMYY